MWVGDELMNENLGAGIERIVRIVGQRGFGEVCIANDQTPTGFQHTQGFRQKCCRFFNLVDLVNKLDADARAERQGRTADLISRLDLFALGFERVATRWLTPR
jgi:hypothetical protein